MSNMGNVSESTNSATQYFCIYTLYINKYCVCFGHTNFCSVACSHGVSQLDLLRGTGLAPKRIIKILCFTSDTQNVCMISVFLGVVVVVAVDECLLSNFTKRKAGRCYENITKDTNEEKKKYCSSLSPAQ